MRWFVGFVAAMALLLMAAGCAGDDERPPLFPELAATVAARASATTEAEPQLPAQAEEPAATVVTEPQPTVSLVADDLFPTVVGVSAEPIDDISWRFDVTMLSEYDSPERYADAWRVVDGDGAELGIRVLLHDHAGEQPFTRSTDVEVPGDVDVVFVEGRDQRNGWSGQRFEVNLTR